MSHTKKIKEEEKQISIERLRKIIKPNTTIYTILNYVGKSGMTRRIKVYVVVDGDICNISWDVSRCTQFKLSQKHDSLIVHGIGQDMGYHVVDSLKSALGFKNYSLEHRLV